MSKIRVLQFPFSQNNGVTAYATKNWEHIDRNRFQFDFVVVRKSFDKAWEEQLIRSGAGIKTLFYSAQTEPVRYEETLRSILREGYDVVHLHTSSWKRLLVEQLAVEYGIPKIIVHSHNTGLDSGKGRDPVAYNRHLKLRRQFTPNLATDFCACSNEAADWLFGEQIPRDRIQILKNAIEVERYVFNKNVRNQYRGEMNLNDCFVIGCVGRFTYQKNHEFLIETFQKTAQRIRNARLLLVGEGPLENNIKEQVQKLGLEHQVIFTGQRNDVPQLLQAMDVFCLPSRYEGLGIVLVEAQASGLMCLTSECIVDEVYITDNLIRLPFVPSLWSEAIVGISKGYRRKNMYKEITDAGYNLEIQIKKVEALYSGADECSERKSST